MEGAQLLVVVLALVGSTLAATVVLLAVLDRAVEVVRLQLLTGRGTPASVARELLAEYRRQIQEARVEARPLRLPLAAMLPSIMFGSLAGVTTESVVAGVATLGVIAAAMMAVLLILRR